MKTSHTITYCRFNLMRMAAALAAVLIASTAGVPAQHAQAQTVVPPPSVSTVVEAEGNYLIVDIDPGSGYSVQGQYVSGPVQPSGPAPSTSLAGTSRVRLTNLVPGSDYVYRFRRTRFQNNPVTSAFTSFTFRTPSLEVARPSTPVIRFAEVTPTTIKVVWNQSTDNVTAPIAILYDYTLNGGGFLPVCTIFYACYGKTELVLARPPSGTRIVVLAMDQARIRSLPSNELIVP